MVEKPQVSLVIVQCQNPDLYVGSVCILPHLVIGYVAENDIAARGLVSVNSVGVDIDTDQNVAVVRRQMFIYTSTEAPHTDHRNFCIAQIDRLVFRQQRFRFESAGGRLQAVIQATCTHIEWCGDDDGNGQCKRDRYQPVLGQPGIGHCDRTDNQSELAVVGKRQR